MDLMQVKRDVESDQMNCTTVTQASSPLKINWYIISIKLWLSNSAIALESHHFQTSQRETKLDIQHFSGIAFKAFAQLPL